MKDAGGNPTGCQTDTAMAPVLTLIPKLSKARKQDALVKGQAHLLSLGITSLVNAGTSVDDIENIKELYRQGKLKMRIYALISSAWGEELGDNEEMYFSRGPEVGLFDNYAWRTIIDSGAIIVNGSDAPIEPANSFHGLYAAVTRMDRDGQPVGGWYPNQRMTRTEALKRFTICAAYGQFEEKSNGSLETGKLADFIVIDRDYMECPAAEIKDIKPLMTVIGGDILYQSPSLAN